MDGDTVAVLMLVVSVASGAFRSLSAGVSSAVSSGDAMLGTDFGAAAVGFLASSVPVGVLAADAAACSFATCCRYAAQIHSHTKRYWLTFCTMQGR